MFHGLEPSLRLGRHPLVKRFPPNDIGRDFVVGDIHGCFEMVDQAFEQIAFDGSRDRLFSVGDLVDRGPNSFGVLGFLAQAGVHAVAGNHETMILDIYRDTEFVEESMLHERTPDNGMEWWRDVDHDARISILDALAALPLVIEIETKAGIVGIVHAEVAAGDTWDEFIQDIQELDHRAIQSAIWGRTRIKQNWPQRVKGVERVFVGHTPLLSPRLLGNTCFLDTGAVFGSWSDDPAHGRLTVLQISPSMGNLDIAPPSELIDLRMSS